MGRIFFIFFLYKLVFTGGKEFFDLFEPPFLSPVIFQRAFRKKFWFLNKIWIWFCGVIRYWRISFFYCSLKDNNHYNLNISWKCSSVKNDNLYIEESISTYLGFKTNKLLVKIIFGINFVNGCYGVYFLTNPSLFLIILIHEHQPF